VAPPREVVDSLESVLGIFFSGVRHRNRAVFILCDELVEMSCKLRAREHDHTFRMLCGFHDAWNAPGVALDPADLGPRVQANRNTRNTMQHASAAATVDDRYCADAILDTNDVIEHCWPSASAAFADWLNCALRVVWLHSSKGDPATVTTFEDAMRDGGWRVENRKARVNEIHIEPGRRAFWHLVLTQNPGQVGSMLDAMGVPPSA
jgi:hypothetical protein